MTETSYTIEPLTNPVKEADLDALAVLLAQTVNEGESVSFLSPLSQEQAADWWRNLVSTADDRAILLVARENKRIVGTVQLQPAWAPNQPCRAEVAKLLVDTRHRRAGLGTRLMIALEEAARSAGYQLLTLDAKRGAAAERLYRRMGWNYVGVIPEYALDPDGRTPHDAVIFYKRISPAQHE